MKKTALSICIAFGLMFMGCTEKTQLEMDIRVLRQNITTAKEVELLRAEKAKLQAELDSFQTRAEINSDVAPVTSH